MPSDLLTSNEEAEVERFYEDLQDLLELTHKKDVLSIIINQHMGFPGGAVIKESACQGRRCRRHGSNLGSGRHSGVGNGSLLQSSRLENSMDRGA